MHQESIKYPPRKTYSLMTPSFSYKVRESMDKRFFLRQSGRDLKVYSIDDKLEGAKFAKKLNVTVPTIVSGPVKIQDIKFPLHGKYVLKPVYSTNSNGITLLEFKEGKIFYLLTGEAVPAKKLIEDGLSVCANKKFKNTWILESFAAPLSSDISRPDDFKIYAFFGTVGIILHKRNHHDGPKYRWYDSNWNIIDTGKYNDALDRNLLPPPYKLEILEQAIRLSKNINKPFMRIDFLGAEGGPVFGEFTPHPGGYDRFSTEFDLFLGRCWEEAEVELEYSLQR